MPSSQRHLTVIEEHRRGDRGALLDDRRERVCVALVVRAELDDFRQIERGLRGAHRRRVTRERLFDGEAFGVRVNAIAPGSFPDPAQMTTGELDKRNALAAS